MGFHRSGQPPAPKPIIRIDDFIVTRLLGALLLAENAPLTRTDPFLVDDPCPFSPAGHRFVGSCGDVACVHCAKVVWS
jgi:hypothetical protein